MYMLEESAYALHNIAQPRDTCGGGGLVVHALSDCGSSEYKMQSGDVFISVLQDCPTALIE